MPISGGKWRSRGDGYLLGAGLHGQGFMAAAIIASVRSSPQRHQDTKKNWEKGEDAKRDVSVPHGRKIRLYQAESLGLFPVGGAGGEGAAQVADGGSLVLGGRSFGGRMCSMAVAEGLPAAGLVLLSYPLHPPGKPEKLRTEHLGALHVPCLFVSGEKDPFGSPAELEAAAGAIGGPVDFVWLPGGHDPRNADDAIVAAVAGWLATLG